MGSMRIMKSRLSICLLVHVFLLQPAFSEALTTNLISNQPLDGSQSRLLEEGFAFASAIPLEPHIKDHARMQYQAVVAALELKQPLTALEFANQIPNWMKGLGLADCSVHLVESGVTNGVAGLLEDADRTARTAQQEWRYDRVKSRIAQCLLLLGQEERAKDVGAGLLKSESGGFEQLKMNTDPGVDLEVAITMLDGQIADGGLDNVNNALSAYAGLYGRFHGDRLARERIEEHIESGWASIPYVDRLDILKLLFKVAVDSGDIIDAQRLSDKAGTLVRSVEWPARYHVQVLAEVAKLQIRCGRKEQAFAGLEEALAVFAGNKESVVNIYRAETLVPVAEAFMLANETGRALEVYALAVEEAVVNINSRPRAEDLSMICLSMAVHNAVPGTEFAMRVQAIKKNLGNPW